jgi:hypothetical protein
MDVDRRELHALLERIPDADLPVTRKLLQALAVDWDVAPAETEGELTKQTLDDLKAAEAFFDRGGKGVPHEALLKEFGLG